MAYLDPYQDLREQLKPDLLAAPGVVVDGQLHAFSSMRSRVTASAIDVVAYLCMVVGLPSLLLLGMRGTLSFDDVTTRGQVSVDGVSSSPLVVALWFACALVFFGQATWRNAGQSIGKRVMGLRVVLIDGSPLTLRAALIRETAWRALPATLLLVAALHMQLAPLGIGLTVVVGVLLVARRDPGHRTFYDRLAATAVVEHDRWPSLARAARR